MRQGGLALAVGRVRSKKQKSKKCTHEKISPHPKHTTKSTVARRPRPPRDGARQDTSHRLAHTPASIDPAYVEIDLIQLSQLPMAKTVGLFFYSKSFRKNSKTQAITATSNRHSDPHRAFHSFKAARWRWKESQIRSELGTTSCRPLWARQRLGPRVSTISEKNANLALSSLPPFRESTKSIKDKANSSDHSTSYY